jgi:molybdate transport system substrate-binding protein
MAGGRRVASVLLALLLGACGGDGEGGEVAAAGAAGVRGEVVVYAAASLTEAFEELGTAFEAEHPDATVTFNFAGSQQLATQVVEGAPAGVFASADQRQMDVVAEAGLVDGTPRVFTANLLEIAVEPGNPRGVDGVEDLAGPGLVVVLAAPEVPAGRYAKELLDGAGVALTPASLEVDVRAVLSRVALGEADAGIVYRSDVAGREGEVEGVAIPEDRNVTASYPIVALTGAEEPAGAAAFVDLVLSDAGQDVLASHGFTAPPAGG